MEEEVSFILEHAKEQMQKALLHLDAELLKIRAGKASPQMLEGVFVDYYGANTPLSNVANVNTSDARTLVIQPWEKAMLHPIEKAIAAANLGLNPQNDGNLIRINVPLLTEDRRKDLVKQSKAEAENAKVSIRNIRREANESIKKAQKEGLPEDMAKDAEAKIQLFTDSHSTKIDEKLDVKEKEIMTV
ncbi:MAG: ribosome recycling factor [Bacteroidetes bacterium]|nr:ribosome recycling factor [Bacteroidota bacterium]HET6243750.1 ribosome recycling factor [Bacteroidia bacterium]